MLLNRCFCALFVLWGPFAAETAYGRPFPFEPQIKKTSTYRETVQRGPASVGNDSYQLYYQDVEVCGQTYSLPALASSDSELRMSDERTSLPGSELAIYLPGKFRSHLQRPARMLKAEYAPAPPPHALLLLPPILSDDPAQQSLYCQKLKAIDQYFSHQVKPGTQSSLRTAFGSLKISALGSEVMSYRLETNSQIQLNDPVVVAEPDHKFPIRFPVHPIYPAMIQIQHVVISTAEYLPEAQALSQNRNASGVGSIAMSLDKIPGIQSGDAVPAQCQGDYADECFVTPSKLPKGASLQSLLSLAGMRPIRDASGNLLKVADAAGLTRAYLRALKTQHPELKYVVLMGDPFQLPPRFTNQRTFESPPDPAPILLSTDFYYSDLFAAWPFADQLSYSPINPIGWPGCGDECAQPTTQFDTTTFRWPVQFPFARSMIEPGWMPNPTPGNSDFLAVGRIIAKTPAGRSRDPAVWTYVQKLARWDAHPGLPNNITVVTGDGVYSRHMLQEIEDQLGKFKYFGEGFGSSYVTPENQPADFSSSGQCYHQPPKNDWHSYPVKNTWVMDTLFYYQSEPNSCKPLDPNNPSVRLPDPKEVTTEVSKTGFTLLFHSAHGGYAGIGYQSDGNGGSPNRSFRNMSIRVGDRGKYVQAAPPVFEDFANFHEANGHPNGFIISSGCNASSFFGGLPAQPLFPNSGRSAAEYLVSLEDAGSVGTYMNNDVGLLTEDPLYDMDLVDSMKKVSNAQAKPRIGDVLIDLFATDVFNHKGPTPVFNRVYLGDPSARLFNQDPGATP